jgi:hypothetical protein
MLIPAFGLLGRGVAEIVSAKQQLARPVSEPERVAAPTAGLKEFKAPDTGDLLPAPPSVTEGTTRLFDDAPQSERNN